MSTPHQTHSAASATPQPKQRKQWSFWRVTLRSLLGPLAWACHFALIYAVQHVLCTRGNPASVVHEWVIGLSVLFVVGLTPLALGTTPWRESLHPPDYRGAGQQFFETLSRWLARLSIVGIVWACAGVFFLPECHLAG